MTALDRVDLTVARGESVGVLGRNGAGKTTLMKILAGVISPDEGEVRRYGRIVPVLSVGGGLNPNLTGRQNAHLILRSMGLKAREADAEMGPILGFSELEGAYDQAMRTYSSGMRSRLAFASAIHCPGDLIILDETLSVGDLSFRMKCYGRIRDMRASGQSFLIVSHSPDTLASFSDRIIVLDSGRKLFDGKPQDAVIAYKELRVRSDSDLGEPADDSVDEVTITLLEATPKVLRRRGEACRIRLKLAARRPVGDLQLRIGIVDGRGVAVSVLHASLTQLGLGPFAAGQAVELTARFENWLAPGSFAVTAAVYCPETETPLGYVGRLTNLRVAGEPEPLGPVAALGHEPRVELSR